MTSKPASLIQLVLIAESPKFLEYGRAVWSALQEVEIFYRRAGLIDKCHRFVCDPDRSPVLLTEWPASENGAPIRGTRSDFWRSVRGRYSRTVDQNLVADRVRDVLPSGLNGNLLVVTDQEITPPPEWRYILWDFVTDDTIISTAPMDPLYWGMAGGDRVAIIKQRLRAAAINATGEFLGFNPCGNDSCYLFDEVESVTCLDSMVVFGKEHQVSSLTGLGFDPRPPSPNDVQDLIYSMPPLR